VTDDEVVIAVAQALARDERTRGSRLFVSAKHGVVVLNGRIDTAETRAAAEEVAAIVPSVRGALNYIDEPGVVPTDPYVWQPRPSQEVYAKDLFLGHVEWVIINPRHPDFALGSFPLPDPGWQPPYPYTHEDVMIEAEGEVALDRRKD
jgi:hypothetical protein